MLRWAVLLVIVSSSCGQVRETEYECGAHGRFEYCIDGVPGCVIGCHCHPGYYFDTDTKICEPNIRLTQNYRRQFEYLEPTRIQESPPTTQSMLEEPATTVSNAVDEKIDIITKDADDLGDWLYNQFFKTIENQVINKTEDEPPVPSRRSGDSPVFYKKPTRRSHKYWKAKRRRKKKKRKKGLKSKLLRITEDDSLFDSSSGSTSDESSDSSASSDTSSDNSNEASKEKTKDNDHGHKKIIVFNKRPKPPLPSFIFLPNMDTPFFPPIGLPPPPMPMYPMVPVPPMMPFPCPPGQPTQNAHENEGQSTNSASSSTTAPDSGTTTSVAATTETTTAAATTAAAAAAAADEPLPPEPEEAAEGAPAETPSALRSRSKNRGRPRQKLIKKIRDKMKRKNKLQNFFANEYQEPEPFVDYEAPSECVPGLEPKRQTISKLNMGDEFRGLQDVDFKYLSQLIHRADLNKTEHIHTTPTSLTKNNLTVATSARRNHIGNGDISRLISELASHPANHISKLPPINTYSPHPYRLPKTTPHRKKIEDTNDVYYANLGRQIASMIRSIDADKEVDIEIEKSSAKSPTNAVFTGNSFGSRSYWERSVRSPLKYLMNSFKKEMNFLKRSNENLYSLENKVEIAASTAIPLSLHELENIISKMEKAKLKLIRKTDNFSHNKTSKSSFNVNLLPIIEQSSKDKAMKEPRNSILSYLLYNENVNTGIQNVPPPIQPEIESIFDTGNTRKENVQSFVEPNFEYTHKNNDNIRKPNEPPLPNSRTQLNANTKRQNTPPIEPELENYSLTGFRRMLPDANYHKNRTVLEKNIGPSMPLTRKQNSIAANTRYTKKNNNYKYPQTVLPPPPKQPLYPSFMQVTTSKPLHHQLNPILNQNRLNHYTGKSNNRLFEKVSPVEVPKFSNDFDPFEFVQPFRKAVGGPVPIFHHELHHFDYFDDLI